jgi:hypothetical protein
VPKLKGELQEVLKTTNGPSFSPNAVIDVIKAVSKYTI